MPFSASSRSSASACATVRGKPSKITPRSRTSGWSSRSETTPITTSSGTSLPSSMIALAFSPTSVPAFTAARSMSPVESWIMPRSSIRIRAWVPLPAPGGPSSMTFMAPSLRYRPRILAFLIRP